MLVVFCAFWGGFFHSPKKFGGNLFCRGRIREKNLALGTCMLPVQQSSQHLLIGFYMVGQKTCKANDTEKKCCSDSAFFHQCGEGEGDCNEDSECLDGLGCGTDNCPAGFPNDYDCCYKPTGKIF